MCGIVGFVNYQKDISSYENVLNQMKNALNNRGPDEDGYYLKKHVALAHKRLIVIDPKGGKQPMIEKYSFGEYVIVFNGQIYNTNELKETLIENGFIFSTYSDTEVLLKAYIHYGKNVVNYLNGIFSFAVWDSNKEELFLARDHFGVKPLYYTFFDSTFIFASELKAIFEYPNIQKILNKQGLSELFGIGPAHTPGLTIYKDIFEIKPAHFAVFNKSGVHIERYWKLKSKQHTESFDETCSHLTYLLKDSINRQLFSDVPICTFLSGGLDSSILTKLIGEYRKENGLSPIPTYSVDYVDNDKNFVKSEFQPNSDNYYINLMTENSYSENQKIVLDTPALADALEDAMIARDMPGMADVDSSLLLFCKQVKQEHTVTLMGECADEIFGGYPWFFREDALKSGTFPWSIAFNERQQLLNPSISKEIDLKELLDYFKSKWLLIISAIILAIGFGNLYTIFTRVPLYKSDTTIVLVSENQNESYNSSELQLNKNLVGTYSEIIKSRKVISPVIKNLKLDYTYQQLKESITVTSITNTEIIKVSVSDKDSKQAKKIANEIAKVFSIEIQKIYKLNNVSIVDKAVESIKPYNVNYLKDNLIYVAIGLVLSSGVIFIKFYFDTSIKTSEEIENKLGMTILGIVPKVEGE